MVSFTSEQKFIGNAYVAVGDFSEASGAGVTPIGTVENASAQIVPGTYWVLDIDGKPSNPGTLGARLTGISMDIDRYAPALLAAVYEGIVKPNTSASVTGFQTTPADLPQVSMMIAPASVPAANRLTDPRVIWIPWFAATNDSPFGITFNVPQEGANSPRTTVSFEVFNALTDQGATAIPEDFRLGFFGNPTETTANGGPNLTAWNLPTSVTT